MKTATLLLSIFLSIFTANAQNLTVGSYNLRLETQTDVGNLWADRKVYVSQLIRFHDFDILGTQEAFNNQLNDLLTALPQYSSYGKGRDDGKSAGEHSAILYKKERFILLDSGDFWLSETPESPSLGWDATCCKRICSWVYLKDKLTRKQFYVFNAHYDHQGKVARIESSKLILSKVKQIGKNKPCIFMGDMNGDHGSEPYKIIKNSELVQDTYDLTKFPYATTNSYNNFGKNLNGTAIIDHVFVSDSFAVTRWGILTDSYQGKYPSDHFPILTEIQWKKKGK